MNKKSDGVTPMMAQWHKCKAQAKDALLLFHMGDFYEAFYEDAEVIAKAIHLTLTKRQNIPMCGVPLHASEVYIDKLLAKGFKVAIADQMEDPKKAKGLVKRGLTRIVTPGTVVSSKLLSEKKNNFFVSLTQVGMSYGIAIIDLTTSEFKVIEIEENLIDELYKIRPSEILISQKFASDQKDLIEEMKRSFSFYINVKEDWYFDHEIATDSLLSHFSIHSLDGFGLKGMVSAINAAGGLLKYITEDLQFNLDHIKTIQTDSLSSYMAIDYTCMKNLEIFETPSTNKNNTLLHLLDHSSTPMGGRLVQNWIKHPLLSCEDINSRQDAVDEFLKKTELLQKCFSHLDKVRDLERLIMRISSNYASPRDVVALRFSLEEIPFLREILSSFSSVLIQKNKNNLKDLSTLTDLISRAVVDQPPMKLSDGNIFKAEYNKDLDELRSVSLDSKTWIANYQIKLREELDIKTIKVGFTRVFGYYIEVSKGQADKMPSDFQRRQTLTNAERFISNELKVFEHKILTAEDRIKALENELFQALRVEIKKYEDEIYSLSKALAEIDALMSLAFAAKKYGYTRPKVDTSDVLHIEKGRHPIIEASMALGKFIPNNTYMDQKDNQLFIITGPNMAGKSTYIRQVALITIMAQIGSFIPAASAHIGLIDRVFSRIGASDDLSRGQSTFMVEMSETANILNNATSRSLIILDEIGRGTSTYDGISIAGAVVEYLLTATNKRAKTLFATHYWELTQLEDKFAHVVNFNVAVQETESGIVFLRKIIKGGTDKSYGIHVAKLAGLPYAVIKRAEEMLKELEEKANRSGVRKMKPIKAKQENQFSLFSLPPIEKPYMEKIEKELKDLEINELSPLEALQKLFELKKLAKDHT